MFRRFVIRARGNLGVSGCGYGDEQKKQWEAIHAGDYNPHPMKGTVRALFVVPAKKAAPVPLQEVRAAAAGFEGDFHTRTRANRRQILMVSADVLTAFTLPPGSLFENMVVDGIDVMTLDAGCQLRVGETLLEVTIPCEPCIQMNRVRPGLKAGLEGKRGMFARVVTGGVIRIGDEVTS